MTVTETMEVSRIAQGEKIELRGPVAKPQGTLTCKGRWKRRIPEKRQKE